MNVSGGLEQTLHVYLPLVMAIKCTFPRPETTDKAAVL